ncbi:Uncharacterised protein [Achromobacter xylosoxidans]|nr:Uncharacterised protein [Achromobacter xylosoxidans]
MPAHHVLAVGRTAAAGVRAREAPAQDADHRAGQRQGHAGHRQPDDDVVPPRIEGVAAERIQPVDPGARVVPQPFAAGGVQHHLAGGGRDVQPRARRIVHVDAVQGPVRVERAGMGVDVLVHLALVVRGVAAVEPGRGAGAGDGGIGARQQCAAGGIYHLGRAAAAGRHQVDRRAAAQRGQAQARHVAGAGGGQGLRRRGGNARRIERRDVRHAFERGELGIAHVHHHHARNEPHGEEQAQHDAGPAVREVQPALGAAGPRHGRGPAAGGGDCAHDRSQYRACSVSSNERGAPR